MKKKPSFICRAVAKLNAYGLILLAIFPPWIAYIWVVGAAMEERERQILKNGFSLSELILAIIVIPFVVLAYGTLFFFSIVNIVFSTRFFK